VNLTTFKAYLSLPFSCYWVAN